MRRPTPLDGYATPLGTGSGRRTVRNGSQLARNPAAHVGVARGLHSTSSLVLAQLSAPTPSQRSGLERTTTSLLVGVTLASRRRAETDERLTNAVICSKIYQ